MSKLPTVKTTEFVVGRHYQQGPGEPFKVIEQNQEFFRYHDKYQDLGKPKHVWYEVFNFIQRTDLDKSTTVQQDLEELLK